MTSIAPPASNPEPPVMFGAESFFAWLSRPRAALQGNRPTKTPRFLHSPDHHSPDSILHSLCPDSSVAPLRLSPFALIPRRLVTPAGSTVQRFKNSTPRSKPQSSNIAGYVSLCESDHADYLSLCESDHAFYLSLFEAMCTYVRLFGGENFISGQKSTVARQPFSTKFA